MFVGLETQCKPWNISMTNLTEKWIYLLDHTFENIAMSLSNHIQLSKKTVNPRSTTQAPWLMYVEETKGDIPKYARVSLTTFRVHQWLTVPQH